MSVVEMGENNGSSAWLFRSNSNLSVGAVLPDDMKFGLKNVVVIVTYANLMWISLLGNAIVFWKLYGRKNRSRVHFMLLHLCVADLLVTVIEMPLQIAWKSTVQWTAGDLLCRLLGCSRVIGLYLNAFLLISISIDRFMSVWDPLSTVTRATTRAKVMVCVSWLLSVICASPQLTVWSLKSHPQFVWYEQCVTFDAFHTKTAELAYGLWVTMLMYGLPLLTIVFCYLGIWLRISHYSRQTWQQESTETTARLRPCGLLTSDTRMSTLYLSQCRDVLSKAKSRTLKMTALVVLIFAACWSPYQIIHIWFFLDRESANQINLLLQEVLFIFGVTSCVVDPYVYGLYSMGIWGELKLTSTINWKHCCFRNRHAKGKRISFMTYDLKELGSTPLYRPPTTIRSAQFYNQRNGRFLPTPMTMPITL